MKQGGPWDVNESVSING